MSWSIFKLFDQKVTYSSLIFKEYLNDLDAEIEIYKDTNGIKPILYTTIGPKVYGGKVYRAMPI